MKYTSIIILLAFILSACNKKDSDTTIPTPDPVVNTSPSHLNPNLTYGSVTDIDGNTYATIVIGTQEWMAENLRTARYLNGDSIPNVKDINRWHELNSGAWVNYDNDAKYDRNYGKLYNRYAVSDERGICPAGWHIPSNIEIATIIQYLDPTIDSTKIYNPGDNNSGVKMKSAGKEYWLPNNNSTNSSGFSALPAGHLVVYSPPSNVNNTFFGVGTAGVTYFWSSTIDSISLGEKANYVMQLSWFWESGILGFYGKSQDGLTCRCIKD